MSESGNDNIARILMQSAAEQEELFLYNSSCSAEYCINMCMPLKVTIVMAMPKYL